MCGTRAVSINVVAFVASVAAVANVAAVTGKSYLRRDHLTWLKDSFFLLSMSHLARA